MLRQGSSVYAVDLFLDVLVDVPGRRFEVTDRDEFNDAVDTGLVSSREAAFAEAHLKELLRLVSTGKLIRWLETQCPFAPSSAAEALPVTRGPVTVEVAALTRPSW